MKSKRATKKSNVPQVREEPPNMCMDMDFPEINLENNYFENYDRQMGKLKKEFEVFDNNDNLFETK